MQFTPKTETELNARAPWPAGSYDFEVLEAEEKVSKAGNPMIALKLNVFDATGRSKWQRDWLVLSFPRKLAHFCAAVGLDYAAGDIKAEELAGKAGTLKLAIETSEQYGEQNKVDDYLEDDKPKRERTMPEAGDAMHGEANDGDFIPF